MPLACLLHYKLSSCLLPAIQASAQSPHNTHAHKHTVCYCSCIKLQHLTPHATPKTICQAPSHTGDPKAHTGCWKVVSHLAISNADAVHLFLPSGTMDLGDRKMPNRAWQKAFDSIRRLGVAELNWEKPGGYTSEDKEPPSAQHSSG